MKKGILKLVSTILVLVLISNMLPMSIFAEEFCQGITQTESNAVKETMPEDAYVVSEITEKRTEYSKEFLLSNGLHMATVYADAVHYETENGWEEIDNTLKANADGTYSNTAGVWEVSFPNQLSQSESVTIEKDGYILSFTMSGELTTGGAMVMSAESADTPLQAFNTTMAQTAIGEIQQVDTTAMIQAAEHPETVPVKLQSQIAYKDVYDNTDIIYDLDSNKVKESVILECYNAELQGYSYTMEVGTLVPVLDEDGSIIFYDETQKNIVMIMPAPYLIDDNGEHNFDIEVQLIGKGSTYTLTYLLPQQWLAAEDRAWPVVLDPVVNADLSTSNIRDRTVAQKKTYEQTWGMNTCGYDSDTGIMRFYLKYNALPALTSSDVVVGASIQMYKAYESSTVTPVYVHKVNDVWDSSTITWSNAPGFNNTIEDYAIVDAINWYGWEITDIVRDWYSNKNTGMVFKASDAIETGGTANFKQFLSSDFGTENSRPVLSIYFRNNNGLESYWDYTASSAGRAGTGYINNYTGNMTFIRSDIGFDGNRMPVSINHVYNLNDAIVPSDSNNSNDSGGNSFGMGIGWRTNFNQLVYQWNINSNYYVWEDSDGTDHYFKHESGSTYKDEDGLELTLTTNGSGTEKYCITDKNGNRSYFDSQGRLTKLVNNQAAEDDIFITYTDRPGAYISTITDGVGRKYVFIYNTGQMDKISYYGTGTTELAAVSFWYNGLDLVTVTEMDGSETNYRYSNKRLIKVSDIDGYTLNYTYNTPSETWQPYRVKSVAESDGNTPGGSLTFSYAHNQTTITDYNGNTETYQFNDFGNTVSIQDDEGHATFAQYARTDRNDTAGKGNQLKVASKMQNSVANVVCLGSFENEGKWSNSDSTISNYPSKASNIHYAGNYALYIYHSNADAESAIYGESFYVSPGRTYTFSAYILCTSGESYLALSDGSTTVTSDIRKPENAWTRVEVTYTNHTTSIKSVTPYIYSLDTGYIFVDCVQIEQESTASRYNLIENGDFRHNSYTWSSTSGFSLKAVSSAAPGMQTAVYSVTGNPQGTNRATQNVKINGVAGDSFVLAGWAKGDSAPLTGNRKFGLQAYFNYTDGTTSEVFEVSFNPDVGSVDNWQYVAVPIVAKKAYSSAIVQLVYDYNVNTVYFDGIQLFKEEFGSSYTYDSKGNVTAVKDLQGQTTTYEYDTNSNLTKIIQNGSAKMTYTYDNWHNVKTATTDEGLKYDFVYDVYGNNTKVSTTTGGVTMESSAAYTSNGNYLASTTDALGKVTTYGYNLQTGALDWVQYPEDTAATRTEYTYDSMYRMATAACTTDTGLNLSAEYTYTDDLLTKIETPSTTYNFTYGDFDLRTGVSIGSRTFATYHYTDETVNDRKYDLDRLDYGNGDKVQYEYDDKGRVTKQTYEDGAYVTYSYDNDGALAKVYDSQSGITTKYFYDLTGRQMKYTESGTGYSHSVGYEYDTLNNLTKQVETTNGTARTTTYTYDADNRVKTSTTDGITVEYAYDAFGRVTTQITKNGSTTILTESYTYKAPTSTATSAQVATYTTTAASGYSVTYSYTYDDNGNILSISDGTNTTTYLYDSANQLFRENNQAGGYTYLYTSDNAGNLLYRRQFAYTTGNLSSLKKTVAYTYGDSQWGDLLTGYNGKTFTYDTIGNLTSDGIWSYTWAHGRQLTSMSDGAITWTYTYDANGMRTSRSNGSGTCNYVYNGSQLVQMTKGAQTLDFTYDANGTPLTVTWKGNTYYYVTNIQGDVTAILDSTGKAVVSYKYNAWGNLLSLSGSMTSLGVLNPLTYRGYVYDYETGLYYLQSRYYDPEMGRFINADSYAATGQGFVGNNMFAYCLNNPVMYKDETGSVAVMTAAATAGVAISAQALLPVAIVVLAVVIFTDSNVQSAIANAVECATTAVNSWTDELEISISGKMTASLAKITPKQEKKYHVHHIVAQSDPRAKQSRWILTYLFDYGVNDVRNLVLVEDRIHQRLHTNAYYLLVEHMIVDAFGSAQPYKHAQTESVEKALAWLQIFITGLSAIS